jgi:hypothetical protein
MLFSYINKNPTLLGPPDRHPNGIVKSPAMASEKLDLTAQQILATMFFGTAIALM